MELNCCEYRLWTVSRDESLEKSRTNCWSCRFHLTFCRERIPHKWDERHANAVGFDLHLPRGGCLPRPHFCRGERISFRSIPLLCCEHQCSRARKVPEQKIPTVQRPHRVSLPSLLKHFSKQVFRVLVMETPIKSFSLDYWRIHNLETILFGCILQLNIG